MSGQRTAFFRRSAGLLLALLFLCPAFSARGEAAGTDMDLLLARNALLALGIRGADGEEILPRRAEEMAGRGLPEQGNAEPDYVGVLGYAALPVSEKIGTFSAFGSIPWQLPFHEKDGEEWRIAGTMPHKTPVLVVAQALQPARDQRWRGYLQVIRLDRSEAVWMNVNQFVTVPYWTFAPEEAVRYGNCIAVYRNLSRFEPVDLEAHRGAMPDGLRVLMCDRRDSRYNSPDHLFNPLMGVVFFGGEETGHFLFFNPLDLTIVY